MQSEFFSYALLAALATGLLVAAFTDLRSRQIGNGLNLAITLGAPLFWFAFDYSLVDIGFQIALALAVFAITAALFAMGQFGGGDVKLLTALALWIAPGSFLPLILMMALIGGGASVALGLMNMQRDNERPFRTALAYVTGVVFVLLCGFTVLGMIIKRPLITPEMEAAIARVVPDGTVLLLAAVAILALMIMGSRHIVRNQTVRLRFPYGVAISLAGIWVLTTQYFPAVKSGVQLG